MALAWPKASLAVVSVVVVLAGAHDVRGDAPGEAQRLYSQGRSEYAAGAHAEALASFEASLRLVASPNARLYVSRSLRALGRIAEAVEAYEETTADATKAAETDPRYRETADAARREVAPLARQVGRVRITLEPRVDGAVVRVGARGIVQHAGERPVAVLPGPLEIRVDAPGRVAARADAEVVAGQVKDVVVRLQPVEGSLLQGPVVEQAVPRGPRRWPAVAAGVVAGLALATAVVVTVMARGEHERFERACDPLPCSEQARSLASRGEKLDGIARVAFITGGAATVVGAVFLLRAGGTF